MIYSSSILIGILKSGIQCFGSGSSAGFGSRMVKMTQKIKKVKKIYDLKCWMISFEA
jgi:hypothetical protein